MHQFDAMTEPELKALFNGVADAIGERMPPGTGFLLLAAPTGEGRGAAQFVSNVRRDDSARWMKETLDRWDRNDLVER